MVGGSSIYNGTWWVLYSKGGTVCGGGTDWSLFIAFASNGCNGNEAFSSLCGTGAWA